MRMISIGAPQGVRSGKVSSFVPARFGVMLTAALALSIWARGAGAALESDASGDASDCQWSCPDLAATAGSGTTIDFPIDAVGRFMGGNDSPELSLTGSNSDAGASAGFDDGAMLADISMGGCDGYMGGDMSGGGSGGTYTGGTHGSSSGSGGISGASVVVPEPGAIGVAVFAGMALMGRVRRGAKRAS
jgi:hypothetical protein